MLKGIQLAKKWMKRHKKHHQYVSGRRDAGAACNKVIGRDGHEPEKWFISIQGFWLVQFANYELSQILRD